MTDEPRKYRPEPAYLGDGVYAIFDGFQIAIYTHDGVRAGPSVYLDRDTLEALNNFARKVMP